MGYLANCFAAVPKEGSPGDKNPGRELGFIAAIVTS